MIKNLTRNWVVISKLAYGIWRNLTRSLESLKNLYFNGFNLTKVYNFSRKFEKKLTWQSTRKSQNRDLDGVLLSKVENTWRKFYEGFTCHFKFNIGNLTNVDSSTPKSKNNFILMDYIWSKYIMFKPKKSQKNYA